MHALGRAVPGAVAAAPPTASALIAVAAASALAAGGLHVDDGEDGVEAYLERRPVGLGDPDP